MVTFSGHVILTNCSLRSLVRACRALSFLREVVCRTELSDAVYSYSEYSHNIASTHWQCFWTRLRLCCIGPEKSQLHISQHNSAELTWNVDNFSISLSIALQSQFEIASTSVCKLKSPIFHNYSELAQPIWLSLAWLTGCVLFIGWAKCFLFYLFIIPTVTSHIRNVVQWFACTGCTQSLIGLITKKDSI